MTQIVQLHVSDRQHEIIVKEFSGNRVVTFKDIDLFHQRSDGTARKRFNDNKDRFILGEDYFVRNSDEAKNEFGIVAPNGLILITESGYLMLVKSFTDDLAWEVQRQLVNTYFKAKRKSLQIPQSLPEALRLAADLAEQKEQLEREKQLLLPKAESFDVFMSGENAQSIGAVAKILGTGQKRLFAALREEKILMTGGERHNLPYQRFIETGYFKVKETPVVMGEKVINRAQTLVTSKGVDFIASRLGLKKAQCNPIERRPKSISK